MADHKFVTNNQNLKSFYHAEFGFSIFGFGYTINIDRTIDTSKYKIPDGVSDEFKNGIFDLANSDFDEYRGQKNYKVMDLMKKEWVKSQAAELEIQALEKKLALDRGMSESDLCLYEKAKTSKSKIELAKKEESPKFLCLQTPKNIYWFARNCHLKLFTTKQAKVIPSAKVPVLDNVCVKAHDLSVKGLEGQKMLEYKYSSPPSQNHNTIKKSFSTVTFDQVRNKNTNTTTTTPRKAKNLQKIKRSHRRAGSDDFRSIIGQQINSIGCQQEPSCHPIGKIAGIVIVDEQTAEIDDNIFNHLTGKEIANRCSDIKNQMYEFSLACHTSYILFLNNDTEKEPVIPMSARKVEENEITSLLPGASINTTSLMSNKSNTLPRPKKSTSGISICSGNKNNENSSAVFKQPSLSCFNPLSPFPKVSKIHMSELLMESSSDHEIKDLKSNSTSRSSSTTNQQTIKEKKQNFQIPLLTNQVSANKPANQSNYSTVAGPPSYSIPIINSQQSINKTNFSTSDYGSNNFSNQDQNRGALLTPIDPNDFRIPEYNIGSPMYESENTENSDKTRLSVDTLKSSAELDSDIATTKNDSGNPELPRNIIFDSNHDRHQSKSKTKTIPDNSKFFDDNEQSKESVLVVEDKDKDNQGPFSYQDKFYLTRLVNDKAKTSPGGRSNRPMKIKSAVDFSEFMGLYKMS